MKSFFRHILTRIWKIIYYFSWVFYLISVILLFYYSQYMVIELVDTGTIYSWCFKHFKIFGILYVIPLFLFCKYFLVRLGYYMYYFPYRLLTLFCTFISGFVNFLVVDAYFLIKERLYDRLTHISNDDFLFFFVKDIRVKYTPQEFFIATRFLLEDVYKINYTSLGQNQKIQLIDGIDSMLVLRENVRQYVNYRHDHSWQVVFDFANEHPIIMGAFVIGGLFLFGCIIGYIVNGGYQATAKDRFDLRQLQLNVEEINDHLAAMKQTLAAHAYSIREMDKVQNDFRLACDAFDTVTYNIHKIVLDEVATKSMVWHLEAEVKECCRKMRMFNHQMMCYRHIVNQVHDLPNEFRQIRLFWVESISEIRNEFECLRYKYQWLHIEHDWHLDLFWCTIGRVFKAMCMQKHIDLVDDNIPDPVLFEFSERLCDVLGF